jgi:hypothetical protein
MFRTLKVRRRCVRLPCHLAGFGLERVVASKLFDVSLRYAGITDGFA